MTFFYQKIIKVWCYTHTQTHADLWGEINVSLFDLFTNIRPVQSIRSCWCIIYMFVCSPTSCLGVVNVDIDQNHQLWWSPPGSSITQVRACQLNPGQREEAKFCFNTTASSREGLGSGLTPGLTALPDHIVTEKPEEIWRKVLRDPWKWIELLCQRPFLIHFYWVIWQVEVKQHLDRVRELRGVIYMLLLLLTDSWRMGMLDCLQGVNEAWW